MKSLVRYMVAGVMGLVVISPLLAETKSDAAWEKLSRDVEASRVSLQGMIDEARGKGIHVDYAAVSAQVISTFQQAAQNDRDRVDEVTRIFEGFHRIKTGHREAAEKLPIEELNDCLELADHAVKELRAQLDGTIKLTAPPDFSKGKMVLGPGCYRLDGRAVFPSSLVWLPEDAGLMQALGNLGGGYYQISNLRPDGSVDARMVEKMEKSLESQKALNAAPIAFLTGHGAAKWMTKAHPKILHGGRHFTKYDIDSPMIRGWMKALYAGMIPAASEACGEQPMVHLLANEPSFATKKGGWLAKNGISAVTMEKYRKWVAEKYKTIEALNKGYGTKHGSFDEVNVKMPIDDGLRGGPVWYDWCRFNMDRVNEWFTFLKKQSQDNDPKRSPVSIKTLGHILPSPDRDLGMDIEYLTKLQEIPGGDLRAVPQGAVHYGKNEDERDTETGWTTRYAYLWVDQSMTLDFTKSLCPDRIFYDSEWHGFSTVAWRNYHLSREYVRSAIWLAFSHGMGAINPWLWGRGEDGSLRDGADHIGELSTQPIAVDAYGRVMKELNAHAELVVDSIPAKRDFVVFYCEEAAIQSESYMLDLKDVYEALKLLNVPTGFVTPSDMGGLNPKNQTVVLSPTTHISDASVKALQDFHQVGGRVVMVGAEKNFMNNELGVARGGDSGIKPFASVEMKSVPEMVVALDAVLAPIKPSDTMEVSVTDSEGNPAYGVLFNRSVDPKTGTQIFVMNNVSKDARVVTLKPRDGKESALMDVISGQSMESRWVMPACDVRVVATVNAEP